MLVKLIEFIFKDMHVTNSGGRNCNYFTVQTTINTHIYDVCTCGVSFGHVSHTDCDLLILSDVQPEAGACSVGQTFGTASTNGMAKPRKPELCNNVIGWRNECGISVTALDRLPLDESSVSVGYIYIYVFGLLSCSSDGSHPPSVRLTHAIFWDLIKTDKNKVRIS